MYKFFFKRFIDFITSFLGLVLLSPLFLTAYLILFFANRGKALFYQTRPGKHGRLFRIVKFKTMNDLRDAGGTLLPDDARVTPIGQFIRRTSIDELPQLLNVIKGDMSLVGPRPLLPEYLPRYTLEQNRRHEVKPGITGWAQVNGRNAISWEEKFKYDVWYVENASFWLDIRILMMSVKKVLERHDISSGTSVTMEEFMGSKQIEK